MPHRRSGREGRATGGDVRGHVGGAGEAIGPSPSGSMEVRPPWRPDDGRNMTESGLLEIHEEILEAVWKTAEREASTLAAVRRQCAVAFPDGELDLLEGEGLIALGITPGTVVTLVQKSPVCCIRCDNTELALDRKIAGSIYIWKNGES